MHKTVTQSSIVIINYYALSIIVCATFYATGSTGLFTPASPQTCGTCDNTKTLQCLRRP